MKKLEKLYIEKLKELIKLLSKSGTLYWMEDIEKLQSEIASLEQQIEQEEKTKSGGWECPRCHKIHSWLSMECDCPPSTTTSTTYDSTT